MNLKQVSLQGHLLGLTVTTISNAASNCLPGHHYRAQNGFISLHLYVLLTISFLKLSLKILVLPRPLCQQ